MMTREERLVGETILQQMGGSRRLSVMLGVKQFLLLPNGVQFRWPCKSSTVGNVLTVTLNDDDTYAMTFSWYRGGNLREVKRFDEVYAEDLVRLFEDHTGWYLRL